MKNLMFWVFFYTLHCLNGYNHNIKSDHRFHINSLLLNFPINIIEKFFKNTEISQIIDSPIVLNILYKKKYKSDIRNIF